MLISPEVVAAITTVPWQLNQAAEAYDDAAARLSGVLAKMPPYLERLDEVEQVHWDSMASQSFRAVLHLLRAPGHLMSGELVQLISAAQTIATDLRHYAQQAQSVIFSLGVVAGTVTEQLDSIWQEAVSSLSGEAEKFVEFIDRHGGIPHSIEEGIRQVLPW